MTPGWKMKGGPEASVPVAASLQATLNKSLLGTKVRSGGGQRAEQGTREGLFSIEKRQFSPR